MKKILTTAFLVSAMAISPGMAISPAMPAENLPQPVIGVVEQATLDKSSALKSIIEQMKKKQAEVQKEMSKYESELKAEDKKLAEQQKTLSEKDFNAKKQAFEKRVHDVQEKLSIRRAQMEIAVDEAKKKVYDAFLKAAAEVKKDAGANIVLYKETVITADPTFDLTNQVLEKLNKQLPTVTVTFKSDAEVKKELLKQG